MYHCLLIAILGHSPSQPINVRVKQLSNGLLLSWLPPKTTPAPVAYYAIEYRTVGQWVPLSDLPILNLTYLWPTASRGVTYQFRVTSYGRESQPSRPSEIITFNTGSKLIPRHMWPYWKRMDASHSSVTSSALSCL